ncbi:MAG: hypothetical protein WCJ86_03285 [Candidatus Saccharibacteria bacterium]
MNKYLKRLTISVAALGLLAIAPIASAETTNTTTTTNTKKTDTSTSVAESANEIKDRAVRLEKEKIELKVKPEAKEVESIKSKCKPAQLKVKDVGDKTELNVKERSKAYTEVVTKLTETVAKLKAKGVVTTTLEQEIALLNTKIALFNTDLATYKTALSDLKLHDCVTDPTGFKAVLESARTANTKLIADAADIKAYIKNTIKPTLLQIRTALEAQEKVTTNKESN